jgi:hypothetical protein
MALRRHNLEVVNSSTPILVNCSEPFDTPAQVAGLGRPLTAGWWRLASVLVGNSPPRPLNAASASASSRSPSSRNYLLSIHMQIARYTEPAKGLSGSTGMPDRPDIIRLGKRFRRQFDFIARESVPPGLNELLCQLKANEAVRAEKGRAAYSHWLKIVQASLDPGAG